MIFFVRMHLFLLTVDTIGILIILCLVYSYFCAIKLSIKYQSYLKLKKMDAFKHKIYIFLKGTYHLPYVQSALQPKLVDSGLV